MPVADPRAGRVFVWLISSIIMLSLAAGGVFLVVYMTQPDDYTASAWPLYAGMSLVCLPWFFWFILIMYRCISRSLGFRIVCGDCCGGDEAEGSNMTGAGVCSATMNRAESMTDGPTLNQNDDGDSGNEEGRHVRFGAAIVMSDGSGGNNGDPRSITPRSSSSSSSSNDNNSSFKSHESEIPLASAMAS
ncbi:hypothetical protein SAY86_009681 [Trapa natans]|uniref:Uncharacterized protein n=1 Tax=Trapa natans TaxID=22666 RepID=A0AAN7KX72_TRANT|nr:hypothetical protein SAY86_009681 [Trapa natans]